MYFNIKAKFKNRLKNYLWLLGWANFITMVLLPFVAFIDRDDVDATFTDFLDMYMMVLPVLLGMSGILSAFGLIGCLMQARESWEVSEHGIFCKMIFRKKQVNWDEIQNLVYSKSFRGGSIKLIQADYSAGPQIQSIEETDYQVLFQLFMEKRTSSVSPYDSYSIM